ncbi:MAG: peptide chain release factor N(5)-glutamine methyltransferase [Gammaproteobacteria bacterium]|jgi:release factor glutamine methyltransferase
MKTIMHALKQAQILLNEPRSGEILLAHVLKKSPAYLYTYPEKMLTPEETDLFQNLIKRRVQGEPIAYIIRKKEFYSLEFKVTNDTLIPRPETEMLVDAALNIIADKPCKVLELGIGAGSVAITIAKLKPQAQVTATDISVDALTVAKENAHMHQVKNIDFILSDWFKDIPSLKFDIIISNPPYIAENDPHLDDLQYEPRRALIAGVTGLMDLEHIIANASFYLQDGGWLLVEHGYDQQNAVQDLFKAAGYLAINTLLDLSGQPRATVGQKSC